MAAFGGLMLAGLGIAWMLTRDKRYLRLAWRFVQAIVLLFVAAMLLYVFERVLLMV